MSWDYIASSVVLPVTVNPSSAVQVTAASALPVSIASNPLGPLAVSLASAPVGPLPVAIASNPLGPLAVSLASAPVGPITVASGGIIGVALASSPLGPLPIASGGIIGVAIASNKLGTITVAPASGFPFQTSIATPYPTMPSYFDLYLQGAGAQSVSLGASALSYYFIESIYVSLTGPSAAAAALIQGGGSDVAFWPNPNADPIVMEFSPPLRRGVNATVTFSVPSVAAAYPGTWAFHIHGWAGLGT